MIRKGIILAAGTGSRLSPITKSVNKQLLPVYNKPLIFYPLSIFLQNKIKDILIIVNKEQLNQFKKILPEKNNLGIKIRYMTQSKPKGLPDAFLISKKFINNESVALILGDNIFLTKSRSKFFFNSSNTFSGAKIFTYPVKQPKLYGVAKINRNKKVIHIEEKPTKPKSNLAITGLYLFDNQVVKFSKTLKPSKRKELEIVDLLNIYKSYNNLKAELLNKKIEWLDAGSEHSLLLASNLVEKLEKKNIGIGYLEQISYKNKWINKSKIRKNIKFFGNCNYSSFLKKIIK
tara:strand:+ start:642 stop:1508 length:867 start_codon:yes stop_codon:yes gene_type:complete